MELQSVGYLHVNFLLKAFVEIRQRSNWLHPDSFKWRWCLLTHIVSWRRILISLDWQKLDYPPISALSRVLRYNLFVKRIPIRRIVARIWNDQFLTTNPYSPCTSWGVLFGTILLQFCIIGTKVTVSSSEGSLIAPELWGTGVELWGTEVPASGLWGTEVLASELWGTEVLASGLWGTGVELWGTEVPAG